MSSMIGKTIIVREQVYAVDFAQPTRDGKSFEQAHYDFVDVIAMQKLTERFLRRASRVKRTPRFNRIVGATTGYAYKYNGEIAYLRVTKLAR